MTKPLLAAWMVMLLSSGAAAQLAPVSNDDLDEVSGQAGIAIALDMRLNADANGNKLAFCNTSPTECRLATSLNNRGTAGVNQEWLVWKGFYGRIFVPYLTLDASSVTYTNDGGGTTTVSAARFGFGGTANKILVQNLTISNMAVERDNLLTAAGTRGYAATSEDGFLGLRINGSIAIEGSLKMFACNSDHPRC
jgi:hypothetical protein